MNKAIIVDIDGTLANCDHRKHFVEKKPKDWKSFYESAVVDEINLWCLDLIRKYEKYGCVIILVSGRPENYRQLTEKWLLWKVVPIDFLFMRKEGDHRKDYIVKQEIYERKIKGKCDVLFVIDDRKQCVDMWRRLGLVCLQCAEGNF